MAVEKTGWSEWIRGERLGFKPKIRPDAIARRPDAALQHSGHSLKAVDLSRSYADLIEPRLRVKWSVWCATCVTVFIYLMTRLQQQPSVIDCDTANREVKKWLLGSG